MRACACVCACGERERVSTGLPFFTFSNLRLLRSQCWVAACDHAGATCTARKGVASSTSMPAALSSHTVAPHRAQGPRRGPPVRLTAVKRAAQLAGGGGGGAAVDVGGGRGGGEGRDLWCRRRRGVCGRGAWQVLAWHEQMMREARVGGWVGGVAGCRPVHASSATLRRAGCPLTGTAHPVCLPKGRAGRAGGSWFEGVRWAACVRVGGRGEEECE